MIRSLPQLEAFYWVARLGSFRLAAERLSISQPSISVRIKDLESDVGSSLFDRGGRVVRLTEHGRLMFDQTERIIAMVSDLDRRMRDVGPLKGMLRMGIPDSFAQACLPKLLKLLSDENPDLNVSIAVDNSRQLSLKFEEGLLDVAIMAQSEAGSSARTTTIGEQTLSWIASPALHPAGGQLTAERLSRLPVLTNPAPSPTYNILMDWFSRSGCVPLRLSWCNNMSTIREVAVSGGGICILPDCFAEAQLKAGTLRKISVVPHLPSQTMCIAFQRNSGTFIANSIVASVLLSVQGSEFVVSQ